MQDALERAAKQKHTTKDGQCHKHNNTLLQANRSRQRIILRIHEL